MKYSKPGIHSINSIDSNAKCVSGSIASLGAPCDVGADIAVKNCKSGSGAYEQCNQGDAAVTACDNGTTIGASCAGGNNPS